MIDLTQRQLYRLISPGYSNAIRAAEQAWRLYDETVKAWEEGEATHADVAEALGAALICDGLLALTYDYAGIDYANEIMASEIQYEAYGDECVDALPWVQDYHWSDNPKVWSEAL